MIIISLTKKFLENVFDKKYNNGSEVANPRFIGSSYVW